MLPGLWQFRLPDQGAGGGHGRLPGTAGIDPVGTAGVQESTSYVVMETVKETLCVEIPELHPAPDPLAIGRVLLGETRCAASAPQEQ